MRFAGHVILGLMATAWLVPVVHADDLAVASNPYTTITERNVFALVPIPPPPPPGSDVVIDPPPKITINGMMTIFGKPQVLFKFTPKAPAGQTAKEVSLVLGEGERQEEVEVTKIDMKAHTASFINHGKAEDVALSDTAKLTAPTSLGPITTAASGGIPMPMPKAGLNPIAAARLARAAGAGVNPAAAGVGDNTAGASAVPEGPRQIYNPGRTEPTEGGITPEVEAAKLANNYLNTKAKDPKQAALFPISDEDKKLIDTLSGN